MAKFTTRVELHDAIASDYKKLHEGMGTKGFKRTIAAADGTIYQLPTAEYSFEGTQTRKQVLQLAKEAASAVKPSYAVLVTEAKGNRGFYGLDEEEEAD